MNPTAPTAAEPCVWMAAGLVNYKLCDHDFDCTRCPLDVALRGGGFASADAGFLPGRHRRGEGFPEDRRYATGHTWVARRSRSGAPVVRVGVDSFAAALLPYPVRARSVEGPRTFRRGDVICDIELNEGTLSVRAPLSGRLKRGNPALVAQPGLIVESPYRDGWLVDLVPTDAEAPGDELVDADAARLRASAHLRSFRRNIALHLLKDMPAVGPCLPDGGEALTNLSEILGGALYLRILREVLR